jgi:hypothetical protein
MHNINSSLAERLLSSGTRETIKARREGRTRGERRRPLADDSSHRSWVYHDVAVDLQLLMLDEAFFLIDISLSSLGYLFSPIVAGW